MCVEVLIFGCDNVFFFGDRGYWLGWIGDKCLVVFSRINFTFVNNYRGRINMNES